MFSPRASPIRSPRRRPSVGACRSRRGLTGRRLVDAKEAEITRLSGLYEANLNKAGVDVIREKAVLEGPHDIRLVQSGKRLSAKHILVASGASPVIEPAVAGLEHAISSNEIFDLPEFPTRLMIVGGGYIAVEFASIFTRLGAKVVEVMRADNILRGFDETMRAGLRDALISAGVDLRFGVLPTAIEKTPQGLRVTLADGAEVLVDQVLVATGRRPHTKGLGLEQVGVALDSVGAIKVDEKNATNIASVHAVGDVTNRVNLTPVAIREGHLFADRLFGAKTDLVDYDLIPTAVFTTPEIGALGLSEAQAREKYRVVDVYQTNFRPMRATISGGPERTIMKILVDGETDRIVGVHVLGEEAGEMAQLGDFAAPWRHQGGFRFNDGAASLRRRGVGHLAHANGAFSTVTPPPVRAISPGAAWRIESNRHCRRSSGRKSCRDRTAG